MIAGFAVTLVGCAFLFALSIRRPQWGVIAVVGLLPFHGLLLVTPLSMSFWKEAAVLTVLLSGVFARQRTTDRVVPAPWLLPLVPLVPFGVISAVIVLGTGSFFPIKIAFFYVLLGLVAVLFPFTRRDKDLFVTVLLTAGILSALYGIWQQFAGPYALADMGYEWNEQIRSAGPLLRSFGTFNQPFPFGLFLMLVIIVGAAAALAEPRRLRSAVYLAAFPVLAAGMILSVVRASYLGAAVGLVVIGVLVHRRFLGWLTVATIVALPVVAAIAATVGTSVLATFTSSSSLEERGAHWSVNLPLILSQPLGQGLGTTGSAAARSVGGYDPAAPLYQPDSYYVKVLLELGPLGMAAYAAVVALMMISLVRIMRLTEDPFERSLAASAVAVTAAACVAAGFSTYLEIFPMDAYFWLLPAIAASTSPTVRDLALAPLFSRRGGTGAQMTESTTAEIPERNDASENRAAKRASPDAE